MKKTDDTQTVATKKIAGSNGHAKDDLDDNTQEIKKIAKDYVRVKTDYYCLGHSLTSKGDKIPELIPWSKTAITDDYPYVGKAVLRNIDRFVNFCCVPDNTDKYSREVQSCYNLYEQIKHKPEEGGYSITESFLKHIFGSKYDVGIDWLTILYRDPTQNLPAVCPVSKENNTGKTTLLKWLREIYSSNAVILGNEDLSSNFNSAWATKLVIGIDESMIEKNLVKEKVKRMITESSVLMERKGVDKSRVEFIGKFLMLSNNERNFIKMDKEDSRFFVVKVPKPAVDDPYILDKMIREIPAFLHHLKTRELNYPTKQGRLWFHPSVFETDALKMMIDSSRNKTEIELRGWLEDIFLTDSNLTHVHVTLKHLTEQLKGLIRFGNPRTEIEKVLKDEWTLNPLQNNKYKMPSLEKSFDVTDDPEIVLKWTKTTGRPYMIERDLIIKNENTNVEGITPNNEIAKNDEKAVTNVTDTPLPF
jgi:hypothetical protein